MKTAAQDSVSLLQSPARQEPANAVRLHNKKRLVILLSILGCAVLIRCFIFPTRIDGASMEPTLHSGQFFLMKRCWFRASPLRRYEIVAARAGGELITKRVIGLPGELVRMQEGVVFINGQAVQEPFPVKRGRWTIKPGLVEPDKYLLMGDNRDRAEQSFFLVPIESVVARQF